MKLLSDTRTHPVRSARTWTAMAVLLPIAAGCNSGESARQDRCDAEALAPLRVLVEGAGVPPVFRSGGTISDVEAPQRARDLRFVLHDDSGADWPVRVTFPVPITLPDLSGARAVVEVVAGFPGAYALSIVDSKGVVVAGAADQALGMRVLREGVSGFQLSLASGECSPRPGPECTLSVRNLLLTVEQAERSAALVNGESAALGAWRVHCFAAQEIVYDPACADAGLHAVSWAIVREPAMHAPGR